MDNDWAPRARSACFLRFGDFEGVSLPAAGDFGDGLSASHEHRNLWAAVIRRALQDARHKTGKDFDVHSKEEARRWFHEGGHDFRFVCMMAGLEPAWVRRRAVAMLTKPSRFAPEQSTGQRAAS